MQPLPRRSLPTTALLAGLALLVAGCGGTGAPESEGTAAGGAAHGGRPRAGGSPGTGPVRGAGGGHPGGAPRGGGRPGGGPEAVAAVPVETARVLRRAISSYIETNGTLEAEFEVDLVARTAGPVVALEVEEGDFVRKGDVLARLDARELRTQLEIARVNLNEASLAHDRALRLRDDKLISSESFDQIRSALDTAAAENSATQIQLDYTEIRAPFDGLIIVRYVDAAEHVTSGQALFRLSDFTPLLCPIQVPERELRRLRKGQNAHITVEAFPEERFDASVLRISPVVDATTGTIKVTLEVTARNLLRPGMFARVFLETDRREDTLVIPKSALSLESIGDTVYLAEGDTARRRDVTLGYVEGDFVEVLTGIAENDPIVVVGQDGLSDGTPIRILPAVGSRAAAAPATAGNQHAGQDRTTANRPAGDAPAPNDPGTATSNAHPRPDAAARAGGGGRLDLAGASPEQIERFKQAMRSRGLSEEQIEDRMKKARQRAITPTQ